MQNRFSAYLPIKTYFNYDKSEIILKLLAGYKRVGIVSGKSAIFKTGFKEVLDNCLKDKSLFYFNEVEENPSINTVIKGGRFLAKNSCDIVIGFGGGSSIDSAKAMALFASNRGGFYELFNADKYESPLPLIAIPTTCGTGSEVNNYCIITDMEKMDKVNFVKEDTFPRYALLFPELLKTLPINILIATTIDAFTHAFEGFISTRANPFSDEVAKVAMKNILTVLKNYETIGSFDYELALYSSSLAGNVILHTGTTLLHALGYYLTNIKNIHHGRANGLLLEKYCRMLSDEKIIKYKYVEDIIKSVGLDFFGFLKRNFGEFSKTVSFEAGETEKFVRYAICKKNAEFTPFVTDYHKVIQYF